MSHVWVVVVAVALAMGLLMVAPASSQASGPKPPVLVSPTDGETVAGSIELVARSSAPLVRFTMNPRDKFTKFVEVKNGVARASFSTYGLDGRVAIGAASCRDERDCSEPAGVQVVVNNPRPQIAFPANKSRIFPVDDLLVEVDAPGGRIYLDAKGYGRLGTKPYEFVLDADKLRAGVQYMYARQCSGVVLLCDAKSDGIRLEIVRPGLQLAFERQSISPNADGTQDAASNWVSLKYPAHVTIEVREAGALVREVPLGLLPATGETRVRYPADLGAPLPDGEYELTYVASLEEMPDVVDRRTTTLTVDTTAPVVRSDSKAFNLFYPHRDRYRDAAEMYVRLDEPARATFEVVDADGTRYFGDRAGSQIRQPDHTYRAIWNGRKAGSVVPDGVYQVRWTFEDKVGNESSFVQRVTADDAEVVERTVRTRLKASDAYRWDVGRCSKLRKDSRWAGGRLLQSDVRCDSSPYDNGRHVVAGYYRIKLPESLREQEVEIDLRGGSAAGRSFLGSLLWIADKGKWSDVRWSRPPTETHRVWDLSEWETARAAGGRWLTWVHFVNRGMQYRVRDITVTTTKAFLAQPARPAPATRG